MQRLISVNSVNGQWLKVLYIYIFLHTHVHASKRTQACAHVRGQVKKTFENKANARKFEILANVRKLSERSKPK